MAVPFYEGADELFVVWKESFEVLNWDFLLVVEVVMYTISTVSLSRFS